METCAVLGKPALQPKPR